MRAENSAGAGARAPRRNATQRPRTALRAVDTTPGPPFDVIESKVRPPQLRAGTISRTALVNRLRTAPWTPLLTICAPAGYGKTTLLAQWAARDSRPFAWVSVDERDNDPIVLLRKVAAALDTIHPIDRPVLEALRSPGRSIWSSALPRLGSCIRSFRPSFVLVIDDSHLVRSRDSVQALSALSEHISNASRLVLAGRLPPRVAIAALRASGLLLEIGPDELALTRREAQLLLHTTGVDLSLDEVNDLVSRCEGWAAALYLAGLRPRDERDDAEPQERIRRFRGDDKDLSDYVHAEYLSGLPPEALRFLARTSVLERMCGGLCDAVLEDEGSARTLEKMERTNLFLVPLDRHRGWYRYHHLFRDLLQRALQESEPGLVPILHGRAADWYEANGDPESALEHAAAAGDTERVARILTAISLRVYHSGRAATVESWLRSFDDAALLARFPGVALQGAWIHALRGRLGEAERWLEAAEHGAFTGTLPDGCTSLGPWIAVLRAALCRGGIDQMLVDAETALRELPRESILRPTALVVLGAAHLQLGQTARSDAIFAEAAEDARRAGAADARIVAIGQRGAIALGGGDAAAAESFVAEASELVEQGGLDGYVSSALVLATATRVLLRRGHWIDAKARLAEAERIRHGSGEASFPWFAAQTQLELLHAYLAVRDAGAARAVLDEIAEILRMQPHLGVLADSADSLRTEVDALSDKATADCSGLTGAELRLLPYLATHLSFSEIGARLYVSRNTVKTQAISIYRKLGVSSRSDAIAEANRLGLIDMAGAPSEALGNVGR